MIYAQTGARMKTVVFAGIYDAARSKMAAAFFNAFTMPSLVRAVSGGTRPLLWVPAEVGEVMSEVGFDVSERPQVLTDEVLERAALIVTFADEPWRPPGRTRTERWDVPDPRNRTLDRVRQIRDAVRKRVWRLVAREGWYRLQPARNLGRRLEQHQRT